MKQLERETDTLHIKAFMLVTREYFELPSDGTREPAPAFKNNQQQQPEIFPAKPLIQRKQMNNYRKLIPSLILASGLGALFAGSAFADMGCEHMGGHGNHHEMHAKHMEAHHKMLHDALKLTPEQEPGWKKLMDSEQPKAAANTVKPEEWSKLTAPERAEKMLELSKLRQEQMGEHVVALKAFYSSLTPVQQKTFEDFHATPRAGMQAKPAAGTQKGEKTTTPGKP